MSTENKTYNEKLAEASNNLLTNVGDGITTDADIEAEAKSFLSIGLSMLLATDIKDVTALKQSDLRADLLKPLENLCDALVALKVHKAGLGKKVTQLLQSYDKMFNSYLKLEKANTLTHFESFSKVLRLFHTKQGLEGLFELDTKDFTNLLKISSSIGKPLHAGFAKAHEEHKLLDFEHIALESVKADKKNNVSGVTVFMVDKNHDEYKKEAEDFAEFEKGIKALNKGVNPKKLFGFVSGRIAYEVMQKIDLDAKDASGSADALFDAFIKALQAEKANVTKELVTSIELTNDKMIEAAGEKVATLEKAKAKAKDKAIEDEKALKEAKKLLEDAQPEVKEPEA